MRVLERAHYLALAVLTTAAGCGGDDSSGNTNGGGTSAAGNGGSASGGRSAGGSAAGGTAGMAGAAGDAGCESPPSDNDVEVAGAYRDDYGFSHRVDDQLWRSGDSLFHVLDHSNEERWLVARNDANNAFNAQLYSRFEWVTANGVLHFCQSQFAAQSARAAREAGRADADDLEEGCGGFSWSRLRSIAIVGSYTDDFGGSHEVTPAAWVSGSSVFHLLELANDARWAVAQNDCDNAYNPGLFSRFEWTTTAAAGGAAGAGGAAAGAPGIYYCQVGYDLPSFREALELESADADELETGCNGFSWSELSASDL